MFGGALLLGVVYTGIHWHDKYPNAQQRGLRTIAPRPLLSQKFEVNPGTLRTDLDAELYSKAYVDEYAMKYIFSDKSAF